MYETAAETQRAHKADWWAGHQGSALLERLEPSRTLSVIFSSEYGVDTYSGVLAFLDANGTALCAATSHCAGSPFAELADREGCYFQNRGLASKQSVYVHSETRSTAPQLTRRARRIQTIT